MSRAAKSWRSRAHTVSMGLRSQLLGGKFTEDMPYLLYTLGWFRKVSLSCHTFALRCEATCGGITPCCHLLLCERLRLRNWTSEASRIQRTCMYAHASVSVCVLACMYVFMYVYVHVRLLNTRFLTPNTKLCPTDRIYSTASKKLLPRFAKDFQCQNDVRKSHQKCYSAQTMKLLRAMLTPSNVFHYSVLPSPWRK